jgi:D-alanyl-D-alanine carboxypeptidase
MKRRRMRAAFFCAVVIITCAAIPARPADPNDSPSVASASVRAAIDAAVQRNRKLYGGRTPVPGVLIGVWDASGHSYVRGYGYADVARKRPLTAADHFRIGSNTKTFVVGVILQLVDEGKLRLDDRLSRFPLGVKVPNAQNITVRELCNMRSGLFEAFDSPQFEHLKFTPDTKFDPRTIIGWAVKQKPYFAPNKGYHYSNTNYLLLGLIIETLTKRSVGDEIRTRFIEPLHLTQTSYPDTQAMPNPWARGYGLDAKRNWEDVSGTIPVSMMGAAGAMISDMADMKRWIALFVTGKVSKPATGRALVSSPVWTGEGNLYFGLALGESAGWYGYTGGLPGYNTGNYYFPAKGVTIVAWVDAQQGKPVPGVANAIFKDLARIMTPKNVPFMTGTNKSGL